MLHKPLRCGVASICRARVVANAVESSGSEDNLISVGIDLGTTNSVVACVTEDGGPDLIPVEDESWILPSVVGFRKRPADVLVGTVAKRQQAVNPLNTFYSVKRLIGREYDDSEAETSALAYKVCSDETGALVLECEHSDEGSLYPEEVSAYVLRKLLDSVTAHTGVEPERAVISVPAYFTEEQREATICAGKMAGLSNIKLIKEPVAAAFAYGIDLAGDQTILVFDLGGGTFDVSILEVGDGVIEVLSTGGDAHLGGDDWTEAIMRHIDKTYLRPAGVDARDPRLRANLRNVAEAAKVKLSSSGRVAVRMPVGGRDGAGVSFTMTRQLLDELTVELWRRCRRPLDQACWQAGVDLGTVMEDHSRDVERFRRAKAAKRGDAPRVVIQPKRRMPISEVLLVGGATRMPSVKQFVRNMTGLEPLEAGVDPDAAVALGSAIYAGVLSGHIDNLVVMEVWQAALARAFAKQQLRDDPDAAAMYLEGGDMRGETDDDSDDWGDSDGEDGLGVDDGGLAVA